MPYETQFDRALAEESRWLCDCYERRMPADWFTARRVYIGPTLPPWTDLRYLGPDATKVDPSAPHSELDGTAPNPPSPSGTEHAGRPGD